MKKIAAFVLMAMLIATIVVGGAMAAKEDSAAPNSGDCIPDGSGWDEDHWPDAGMGPAPNAGDGIPDGSGF